MSNTESVTDGTSDHETAMGNGQSDEAPSWFLEHVAKQEEYFAKYDAKNKDLVRQITKLKERSREPGESNAQTTETAKARSEVDMGEVQNHITQTMSYREAYKALPPEAQQDLDELQSGGASVEELSRTAAIIAKVAKKSGATSQANSKPGYAGTAANNPAGVGYPMSAEEAHEILTDPEKFKKFTKKYPDFDFRKCFNGSR